MPLAAPRFWPCERAAGASGQGGDAGNDGGSLAPPEIPVHSGVADELGGSADSARLTEQRVSMVMTDAGAAATAGAAQANGDGTDAANEAKIE